MKKFTFCQRIRLSALMLVFSAGWLNAAEQPVKVEPVQQIMQSYYAVGRLLAKDSINGIAEQMQKIVTAASVALKAERTNGKDEKAHSAKIKSIQAAAKGFVSRDIKTSRESFKALSHAVSSYVKACGYSSPAYSFYCPMAGQTWLQSVEQVANPFFGLEMLKCGKMTGMVKEGKYVEKSNEATAEHGH